MAHFSAHDTVHSLHLLVTRGIFRDRVEFVPFRREKDKSLNRLLLAQKLGPKSYTVEALLATTLVSNQL